MNIPTNFRVAGAALGLAAPALIAGIHGQRSGYLNPNSSGLGGGLGYGLLLSPMTGVAYGLGHMAGREKAKDKAISNLQNLGALGAGILTQGGQISYPNPQAAQAAMQFIQNPQMIDPYTTNLSIQ